MPALLSSPDPARGAHLSVDGVSLAYSDRRVLTDLSFTARTGDRLGLIGENGTGKSTLLRVIAGAQEPDSGTVSIPGSVALLDQQLPYQEGAPISLVLDDSQRESLDALERLETCGTVLAERPEDPNAAEDYAAALENAELVDAWGAAARRGETLAGLDLSGIPLGRTVGELSGGQRVRLALASVLLRSPHTLLLDEPSNHLDDAAAGYLERVLQDWPGIVVFASHDRALLDAVATRILDLDPLPVTARELQDDEDLGSGLGVRLWGIGYSAARAERVEELRRWAERYEAETDETARLRHEIEVGSKEVNRKHEPRSEAKIARKFYADKDARVTSRRARNARGRLETLERERVRRPPEPLRFRGFEGKVDAGSGTLGTAMWGAESADSTGSPKIVLSAECVAISGRLTETSLELRSGERLLLTGPNGCGKSTLLTILAGRLVPEHGRVTRCTGVGYLPQEVFFEHAGRSASETYRDRVGAATAERVPLDSLGLLAPRDLQRPVGALSVGQRRRLALAALVAETPPTLILDEPTNHLSLSLVEELEAALREYPGAVIVASHDRWLREHWQGGVTHLSVSPVCP